MDTQKAGPNCGQLHPQKSEAPSRSVLRVLATPCLSSEETINVKIFSVFTGASHQSDGCISQMHPPWPTSLVGNKKLPLQACVAGNTPQVFLVSTGSLVKLDIYSNGAVAISAPNVRQASTCTAVEARHIIHTCFLPVANSVAQLPRQNISRLPPSPLAALNNPNPHPCETAVTAPLQCASAAAQHTSPRLSQLRTSL